MTRTVWLFDLDNTLHDASPHIFPHINRSMTAYLERHLALDTAAANALRVEYWHRYGATLLGLMRHHGTDPHHFLAETHRFDRLSELMVFPKALRGMLHSLPGPKIVFSNGPKAYARSVVDLMGLKNAFQDVFGIEDMGFQPKPNLKAFQRLLHTHRLQAHHCMLVEDSLENLRAAKRLGIGTVWVTRSLKDPACVDHKIPHILALRRIGVPARRAAR
ncbi:MAG: pyrimidine 5'-nucleotidase [Zoogloeaceae bacterium]|nr:pyrimidine 5'-nucleotidase [Zoogloeaceae bacterium]